MRPTGCGCDSEFDRDTDHTKPHWCHHDGLDALVPPPNWLFYIGKKWSTDTLETRDCSHVAAPRVVDVVDAL